MRTLTLILGLTLLGTVLGPQSKASEFDKKTIMTFSQPVQIPGAVLGAGTYVVQRADPGGNPDVVRFMSADSMHTYATVLTVPAERGKPPDKPEVTFAETRGGTPQAIKKWWYPGEVTGEEFIYPKGEAVLTARASGLQMPSRMRTETAAPPVAPEPQSSVVQENDNSSAMSEPAPVRQEDNTPVETAQNTPPPEPQTSRTIPPADNTNNANTLPKTASDVPLIAMIGALSLLAGASVKKLCSVKS